MAIAGFPLLHALIWLLFSAPAFAQSGCGGDSSTYDRDGLIVPFRNLCGKDITAVVDFLDPTDEPSWSECMARCVEKKPLCYGFDFTTPGFSNYSCWLMNAPFDEASALPQPYTVDAAMLTPAFLLGLADNCETLGLKGCFEENGRLGTQIATVRAATATTSGPTPTMTSVTTPGTDGNPATTAGGSPAEGTGIASSRQSARNGGLSASAKAGVGAGIGAVVLLLLICAFLLFKRRRARSLQLNPSSLPEIGGMIDGKAELPADQHTKAELDSVSTSPTILNSPTLVSGNQTGHRWSELEGPPSRYGSGTHQPTVHELDPSPRTYRNW